MPITEQQLLPNAGPQAYLAGTDRQQETSVPIQGAVLTERAADKIRVVE